MLLVRACAACCCSCKQAQQLLSLLGHSSKRLKAGQLGSMAPLLSQLQPEQRLLLFHYNESRQVGWEDRINQGVSLHIAAPCSLADCMQRGMQTARTTAACVLDHLSSFYTAPPAAAAVAAGVACGGLER
jgi:hypothetical protein